MSALVFALSGMSPVRRSEHRWPAAEAALRRMALAFGRAAHDERRRRNWTLRDVADRACARAIREGWPDIPPG